MDYSVFIKNIKEWKRGKRLRKYIALLLLMSILGGIATVYLMAQSSLAVIVNNDTDEEISGLVLTYEHIEEDIQIDPIAPGEDAVLKIDPESQASDSFQETSLELQYTDNKNEEHTETVFNRFNDEVSGDAEVTIQEVDEGGILSLNVEENLGDF